MTLSKWMAYWTNNWDTSAWQVRGTGLILVTGQFCYNLHRNFWQILVPLSWQQAATSNSSGGLIASQKNSSLHNRKYVNYSCQAPLVFKNLIYQVVVYRLLNLTVILINNILFNTKISFGCLPFGPFVGFTLMILHFHRLSRKSTLQLIILFRFNNNIS